MQPAPHPLPAPRVAGAGAAGAAAGSERGQGRSAGRGAGRTVGPAACPAPAGPKYFPREDAPRVQLPSSRPLRVAAAGRTGKGAGPRRAARALGWALAERLAQREAPLFARRYPPRGCKGASAETRTGAWSCGGGLAAPTLQGTGTP